MLKFDRKQNSVRQLFFSKKKKLQKEKKTLTFKILDHGIRSHYFIESRSGKSGNSNEIKRCLLPERTAMTKLDRVLKTRDITLLTDSYSQSYAFSQ